LLTNESELPTFQVPHNTFETSSVHCEKLKGPIKRLLAGHLNDLSQYILAVRFKAHFAPLEEV
jgi:hypothetical protein